LYFIQDHVPAVSSAHRKAVLDEVMMERAHRISV